MKNLLIILFSMLLLIACNSDDNISVNNNGSTPELLKDVENAIEVVFKRMSDSLQYGTSELAQTGINEESIRQILKEYVEAFPYLVDCCYVDTNGIMKYVEPEEYREFEGSDISDQEHIIQILDDHNPVSSGMFLAVEGFWAIDFEYPIFVNNQYAGSLSMLIEPKEFLEEIIQPLVKGVPVEFWVMENSGRIVYDPDEEEIGRIIFLDDMYKQYPDLIELARTSLEKDSGEMSYQFFDTGMNKIIRKNAYWVTVSSSMETWKIFMTHPDNYIFDDLNKDDIDKMQRELKDLATNENFVKNIANNKKDSILSNIVDYYFQYPNIYTISWVDETAAVRFGLPKENSLEDYQFTREKDPQLIKFIESVEKGEEAAFEVNLIEGKKGSFYMYPIKDGSDYYGMLYYIYLVD